MKNKLWLQLLPVVLCIGCHNPFSNKEIVMDFIPGTYTREIRQQYAFGTDTLIITAIGEQTGMYSIVKKSRFRRKVNDQLLAPENHSEIWMGMYDDKNGQLHEQKLGRIFSFDADGSRLFMGSSEYKKVP